MVIVKWRRSATDITAIMGAKGGRTAFRLPATLRFYRSGSFTSRINKCLSIFADSSIRAGEDYTARRGLTANHVYTRSLIPALERDAAYRGLGLGLDLLLCLGSAVPVCKDKSTLLYLLLEFFVGVDLKYHAVAECLGLGEKVGLDIFK